MNDLGLQLTGAERLEGNRQLCERGGDCFL